SVTASELLASQGADMITLNVLELNDPKIHGLDLPAKELIPFLKTNTGCFFGCNLEPSESVSEGRKATVENAKQAVSLGLDYIVITGNPGTGVTMRSIIEATKVIRAAIGDQLVIISGKMHDAGSLDYVDEEQIRELKNAGCDIFMTAAPGTTPFHTVEHVRDLFLIAKKEGMLTKAAIGTTQETSPIDVVRQIALMSKMSGADIVHIGDAGMGGICTLENLWNMSLTIRGSSHSYRKIANRRLS
ncbi:MAG: radical SAM protein, partial [Brevinema sp.]